MSVAHKTIYEMWTGISLLNTLILQLGQWIVLSYKKGGETCHFYIKVSNNIFNFGSHWISDCWFHEIIVTIELVKVKVLFKS